MIFGNFSANLLNHQKFRKIQKKCDFCQKSIFLNMLHMLSYDDIWDEMSSWDLKKSFEGDIRHPRCY